MRRGVVTAALLGAGAALFFHAAKRLLLALFWPRVGAGILALALPGAAVGAAAGCLLVAGNIGVPPRPGAMAASFLGRRSGIVAAALRRTAGTSRPRDGRFRTVLLRSCHGAAPGRHGVTPGGLRRPPGGGGFSPLLRCGTRRGRDTLLPSPQECCGGGNHPGHTAGGLSRKRDEKLENRRGPPSFRCRASRSSGSHAL